MLHSILLHLKTLPMIVRKAPSAMLACLISAVYIFRKPWRVDLVLLQSRLRAVL